jgi:hypothetical protein
VLLWNRVPNPVFNPSTGERAGGAKAYFYVGGTNTPLAVYTSDDGATPHPDPVVADANGVFPPIFIPYGPFGYRVTTATGTIISPTVSTVQNPAPPDSGGGGGIVVQADQILQTGDTMWTLRSGTRSGWVRMNERTIGSVGSGATERANADTEALFIFLWTYCDNTVAPVSGGRGTTAEADFAANKTITVPTMAGYLRGGLDDMGNGPVNRLQRSTTISTTNLSTTATVASASGLTLNMKVLSANVPAGTTITNITGTTITLSANATATASGTAARFSMFGDAQQVGSVGGSDSRVQAGKEVGSHGHTASVTDPGHSHPGTADDSAASVGPGANPVPAWSPGTPSGSATTGISVTVNASAAPLPMSILQPTRLGTDYMKL